MVSATVFGMPVVASGMGTPTVSVSGQTHPDGSQDFTVDIHAPNGLRQWGIGLWLSPIDSSWRFYVSPDGSVIDGYPSAGAYGYIDGVPVWFFNHDETSPWDLHEPMDTYVPPTPCELDNEQQPTCTM